MKKDNPSVADQKEPAMVRMESGILRVPDQPVIPFIEGDGIGPDIWRAARRVLDRAVEKAYNGSRKIHWKEILAGQKAFNLSGAWLPDATIKVLKDHLISLKGPLTTPVGGGIRSLNVTLRLELDLYACIRPVRWFEGVPSPLTRPREVDMVIFRENTEDIYTGIEWMTGTPQCTKLLQFLRGEMGVTAIRFPESSSLAVKPVSREGSQRLVRSAIRYALSHNRHSLTLVHKGNILKFTEGAFRNWGYELAASEFGAQTYCWPQWEQTLVEKGREEADREMQRAIAGGKLIIKDLIADNFFQQILLSPADYSVIATMNLNGDYISDCLAAAVGGIGIAPGANVNDETGHALFEATHGTAPQLAGQDSANPSSLILSGEMMLRYLGWWEAAELVEVGIRSALQRKMFTIDFYRQVQGASLVSCSGFASTVLEGMGNT